MSKIKMIFNQTLMISTGILFCVGISQLFEHFAYGWDLIEWKWYIPLSFVFSGFLCALPSLFLFNTWDSSEKSRIIVGRIMHFVFEGAIVSVCGFVFEWYTSFIAYLPVLVMYVLIYVFVWMGMQWIYKKDDDKINAAIKEIRDEE